MVVLARKEWVFILKFFVFFSLSQLLILVTDLSPLQEAIAHLTAGWAMLSVQGINIIAEEGVFVVSKNCTGLISAMMLGSIVFALKKPDVRKKFLLFAASTILLLALNLVRVYGVVMMGILYGFSWAEAAHIISWYAMSAAIIGIWFYGTRKVAGVENFRGFL